MIQFKRFQHVDVTLTDHHQYHAIQVDNVLVNQMLLAPNVQNVNQAFMDCQTVKVKINAFQVSTV